MSLVTAQTHAAREPLSALARWTVASNRACRRRRARRRRAGRLLLGDLALLPARAVRLGRGDRPRADGRAGIPGRRNRARTCTARRRRESAQVVSGALARVRGATLPLDRRRSRRRIAGFCDRVAARRAGSDHADRTAAIDLRLAAGRRQRADDVVRCGQRAGRARTHGVGHAGWRGRTDARGLGLEHACCQRLRSRR